MCSFPYTEIILFCELRDVPHTNLCFGSHSFHIAAPTICANVFLSFPICSSQTLNSFRKHLETYLFLSVTLPANPAPLIRVLLKNYVFLWSPYVIGQTIIFSCCGLFFFFFLSFFSSPNLSSRKLDAYHTSAHGVVLV